MNAGARAALGVLGPALGRRRRQVAAVAAWSAVQALPMLVLGRAVASATDAFLARQVAAGFGWLAVLVLAAVVGAVGSRQVFRATAGIVEPLRDDLVRRVVHGALRRSVAPGTPLPAGVVSRLTSQVEVVRDTFAGLVVMAGTFVFTAGSALLGLLTLAPVAVVVVGPPLAVAVVLFAGLLPVSARRQRAAILADEAVAETATTVAGALRDIVACGADDDAGERLGARVDAQARAVRGLATLGAARVLALAIGGWLPLVLILALAPWLLRRGITAGTLLGMLAYVRGGVQPALNTLVHGVGGSGMRLAVTLERIVEAGAPAPVTVADRPGGGASPAGRGLEVRGATFAYSAGATPVIRDLDLVIPEGDHLAIVGPSGIGKSTLAGLLTGMLRPLAGEVELGGAPLGSLDPAVLPLHRVLIPQEAYVFAGTLLENLACLRPDAPGEEALDAAVDAVGMRPLLEGLGGYPGRVDPAALSAGERQLIALTRAYLSPAPIAVLDEATCHLDPIAESRAELAFARRPGTLVVIAHRVSSALRARRILALDGAEALTGTHETLLAASPLYRDLVGHWRAAGEPAPAGEEAQAPSLTGGL